MGKHNHVHMDPTVTCRADTTRNHRDGFVPCLFNAYQLAPAGLILLGIWVGRNEPSKPANTWEQPPWRGCRRLTLGYYLLMSAGQGGWSVIKQCKHNKYQRGGNTKAESAKTWEVARTGSGEAWGWSQGCRCVRAFPLLPAAPLSNTGCCKCLPAAYFREGLQKGLKSRKPTRAMLMWDRNVERGSQVQGSWATGLLLENQETQRPSLHSPTVCVKGRDTAPGEIAFCTVPIYKERWT